MPLVCPLTTASLLFIATTETPPRMGFSIPATDSFPPGMPPSHPLQDLPLAAPFAAVSGTVNAHDVLPNPCGDDMFVVPIWPAPASAEQRPAFHVDELEKRNRGLSEFETALAKLGVAVADAERAWRSCRRSENV